MEQKSAQSRTRLKTYVTQTQQKTRITYGNSHLVWKVLKLVYLWWNYIVQELCESRGGRPGLPVLTSLLVSVDVKIY